MIQVDTGVQAERTALAWRRTSVALLTISTLLLRWFAQHGWGVLIPSLFALYLSLTCAYRLKKRYGHQRQGISRGHYEPAIAMILLMTGGILMLAIVAAYIAIGFAPGG